MYIAPDVTKKQKDKHSKEIYFFSYFRLFCIFFAIIFFTFTKVLYNNNKSIRKILKIKVVINILQVTVVT